MRKTFVYAVMGAIAITGLAETMPEAMADPAASAPRSFEQLRDKVRAEGMESLAAGDLQTVAHRRWHRGRVVHRRRYAPRYSMRYIHRRGHWCGRRGWYGRRCYYTPRVLRPFRQR